MPTLATVTNASLTHLAFIDGIGGPEMLLVLVIVLLLFGGDKLPEFARGMGKTMRELKKAASGVEDEFRRAMEEDERKKARLKQVEEEERARIRAKIEEEERAKRAAEGKQN